MVVMAVTHVPWLPMIDKDDPVNLASAPQRRMAPGLRRHEQPRGIHPTRAGPTL